MTSPFATRYRWGTTQTAAISSTLAVVSNPLGDQTRAIRVTGTAQFCLNFSSSTASTSHPHVPANTPQILSAGAGEYITIVSGGTSTGTFYLTELS